MNHKWTITIKQLPVGAVLESHILQVILQTHPKNLISFSPFHSSIYWHSGGICCIPYVRLICDSKRKQLSPQTYNFLASKGGRSVTLYISCNKVALSKWKEQQLWDWKDSTSCSHFNGLDVSLVTLPPCWLWSVGGKTRFFKSNQEGITHLLPLSKGALRRHGVTDTCLPSTE